MNKVLAFLFLFALSNCGKPTPQGSRVIATPDPIDPKGYNSPLQYDNYHLAWSDEFDKPEIDQNTWSFETGSSGWGNNELENYTGRKENASINDGYLVITARKENYQGSSYTSARMVSRHKKSFRYGRIDIRAKLPEGQGIWPALWMLGENIDSIGWPACGEIDIMEMIGHQPSTLYGTLHWGTVTQVSKGDSTVLPSGKFHDEFHVFSLLWDEESMKMLLDDHEFFSLAKSEVPAEQYPFDAPQFFILNVAVGGDWPGSPDATTVFPQKMVVDFVRVFQKN